jgi:hypothetical protein
MTTIKQKNYIKYLESIKFKVSAIDDKNLTYSCPEYNHSTEIALTSFSNKKAKFKETPSFLCTECKNIFDKEESRLQLQGNSVHEILVYHDKENVEFICNNCGSHKKSTKKCLETSEYCSFCQNNHQRKPHCEVERQVKEKGMTLLTTEKEYTDNKNLTVLCSCGSEWKVKLFDIKRGRKCGNCKTERTVATNNIKYGVDNVMHHKPIFQNTVYKERQKQYFFQDGSCTMIMGYEDLTLKELEKSGLHKIIYAGDNINIPSFWYVQDGKKHKYYPDIYLPETNTIIEVKSDYYLNLRGAYEKTICKAIEVAKTHNFLLYIYENNGKKRIIYQYLDGKFEMVNL